VVQILSTVQEAEAFVSSGHERAGGTLKITAPTGFSRMHVAPYLGKFLKQYPDLSVEIIATDTILDIVREGIDVAIRLSELDDSSMVAKKLAPCRRLFCATPSYLKEHGTPKTLADLSKHKAIVENNMAWRLQGPEGITSLRLSGEIKTNSSDVVHQALLAGCGIALRSTWQVRDDLLSKKLVQILPQYCEAPGVAVYAIYPDKQYIPARLRVFVDFLAGIYSPDPYWDEGLDLDGSSRQALKKTLLKEEEPAEV
jgi:DNA-binding transcriptional LysR family regulator